MRNWSVLLITVLIGLGCSSGSGPVIPGSSLDTAVSQAADLNRSQTHLWGYYDISIDIESRTVEVVPNRRVTFAANVVTFLNANPANLGFQINDTPVGPDYVDVDIDVSITHPFPGMPQYNGYDVRGIFMGDGSMTLEYNPDLIYPGQVIRVPKKPA